MNTMAQLNNEEDQEGKQNAKKLQQLEKLLRIIRRMCNTQGTSLSCTRTSSCSFAGTMFSRPGAGIESRIQSTEDTLRLQDSLDAPGDKYLPLGPVSEKG